MLVFYFHRLEHTVAVNRALLPMRLAQVRRILEVGLPSGAEFLLMFVNMAVIYAVIARFGSEAQAGFGIGQRVMQSLFLPVMAVAFAAAPIAGQNFGAGNHDRVRATFKFAALFGGSLMLAMSIACHIAPATLIAGFTDELPVITIGAEFLTFISWNFVASAADFHVLGNVPGAGKYCCPPC